jgi:hypothetical protein
MRTRIMAITLTIGALAAAVACGDKKGFVSPSPPETSTLSISGPTTLRQPGETSQLAAIVTLKDGTKLDVTGGTAWSGGTRSGGSQRVVSVTRGLLTAVAFGETTIAATYSTMSLNAAVPVRVAPDGMFFVSGHVRAGAAGVPAARVEATSPAGTLSTVTESDGSYFVPAAGDVTLRVEKDGYRPEVRRLTVNRDVQADVDLQWIPVAGDPVGIWRLTIAASSSCSSSLPPEAMRREYTAEVERKAQDVTVWLSGGGGPGALWEWGFTGTHDGTTIVFRLSGDPRDDYSALEQLDSSRVLGYSGTAVGTATDTSMVAVLSGQVVVTTSGWPRSTLAECSADNHRLVFLR